MRVREQSEKTGLKLNIKKLTSRHPVSSQQIDGGKVETMTDFTLLAYKIIVDDCADCNHEIKRCLLLERKIMTNPDCVLKSRDIILLTEVHLVKAMVFPVVMYGCESWTIKKA